MDQAGLPMTTAESVQVNTKVLTGEVPKVAGMDTNNNNTATTTTTNNNTTTNIIILANNTTTNSTSTNNTSSITANTKAGLSTIPTKTMTVFEIHPTTTATTIVLIKEVEVAVGVIGLILMILLDRFFVPIIKVMIVLCRMLAAINITTAKGHQCLGNKAASGNILMIILVRIFMPIIKAAATGRLR